VAAILKTAAILDASCVLPFMPGQRVMWTTPFVFKISLCEEQFLRYSTCLKWRPFWRRPPFWMPVAHYLSCLDSFWCEQHLWFLKFPRVMSSSCVIAQCLKWRPFWSRPPFWIPVTYYLSCLDNYWCKQHHSFLKFPYVMSSSCTMYAESGGHFEKWPPFCFWRDILKPPYLKVFVGRITTNPASFMLLSSTEQLSLKSALL